MTNMEKEKLNELKILKAELKVFKQKLQEKIESSEQIFITTHKNPDIDAISSAIGLSLIAKKLKKKSYIIMDDKIDTINSGVLTILDTISDDFQTITTKMYKEIKTDNDLLVVTDTNKRNLICCEDYLDDFKSIVVIDHHNQDSRSIQTLNKFIKPKMTSACEIVSCLIEEFKINYSQDIANYFLAGIILDSNNLRTETSTQNTFEIVSKLIGKGANINFANELLDENFETEIKVNDIIKETNFYSYTIAICCSNNTTIIPPNFLAKAANKLKGFNNDLSCVIGRIDENTIKISARSNGKINADEVMKIFDGGGDIYRAAASIEDTDIENVKKRLIKVLKPTFYINERDLKNEES